MQVVLLPDGKMPVSPSRILALPRDPCATYTTLQRSKPREWGGSWPEYGGLCCSRNGAPKFTSICKDCYPQSYTPEQKECVAFGS